MNEKNKTYLIMAVIAIFVVMAAAFSDKTPAGSIKASDYESDLAKKVATVASSKEVSLIYFGRPTCSYCAMLQPFLTEFNETYGLEYTYVNTDEEDMNDVEEALKMFNVKLEEFGTPYLVITKNGAIVKEQKGYAERDVFFDFLKSNGMIEKSAVLTGAPADENNDTSWTHVNALDTGNIYNDASTILASAENKVIYMGRPTCSYCQLLNPILDKIESESDLKYHYIDTDKLSEDELIKILGLFNKEIEKFGTPYLVVVKDGKVVNEHLGYAEQPVIEKFLKENSIIK